MNTPQNTWAELHKTGMHQSQDQSEKWGPDRDKGYDCEL